MRFALLAAAVLILCAGAAVAQTSPPPAPIAPPTAAAPTPEMRAERRAMRDACAADIKTYCADATAGGGRIGQCFRDHAADLSPPCKDALVKMRAQRRGQGGGPAAPGS